MSTRLVFDLAPMTCPALEEAAFREGISVRLGYEHPEDMPERLLSQVPKEAVVDLLQLAGNITGVEGAETDALVRFTVVFGSREREITCKYVDLVPVERIENTEDDYQLVYRRQLKEPHEEALRRQAEGSDPDADEASVEAERAAKTWTGGLPPIDRTERLAHSKVYRLNYTEEMLPDAILLRFGEGWTTTDALEALGTIEDVVEEDGQPVYNVEFVRPRDSRVAMLNLRRDDLKQVTRQFAVDEATPGKGAVFITKVYLSGVNTPILVHGEARKVAKALEEGEGYVWFQVVNREGMITEDEVGIRYVETKSIKSDNEVRA